MPNIVILMLPRPININDLEFQILPDLKYVINQKGLCKIWVQIILDHLGFPDQDPHAVLRFLVEVHLGVAFAQKVHVFEVSATDEELNFLPVIVVERISLNVN